MSKHRLMIGLAIVAACCIGMAAGARADCPGDESEGAWSPAKDFTSSPLVPSAGCARMYYCGPREQIMYDSSCRIVATPAQSVGGVCTAGGGPVDSCNACLTNPPSDRCMWHLETR